MAEKRSRSLSLLLHKLAILVIVGFKQEARGAQLLIGTAARSRLKILKSF
jgi:hypothetical protein